MLTPAQIEFYRDQGFLGIENVFSAEVAALRRVTDEFVEKPHAWPRSRCTGPCRRRNTAAQFTKTSVA